MKLLCKIAAASFLFYLAAQFCVTKTDGFSVFKITPIAYESKWDTILPNSQKKEIDSILSQKFSYLGFGGQCYAFLSEDGNYVIKFFKEHTRHIPETFASLPPWQKKRDKRLFKRERDFNSCKIAYSELKDESGLLYIHLNKTSDLPKTITILDKLHIAHTISLNDKEFILQKKAELFYPHLEKVFKSEDPQAIKDCLGSILDLLISRCKKGIFDEDPKMHRNLGFIANRPIFIDIGRFTKDEKRKEPSIYLKDIQAIATPLKTYLEKNHPAAVETLKALLQEREYATP
jgi:hypothetical protein